ncbi:hypothetical protein L596_009483 [Steinernema carpocapsae]|uniref:G-protein coupled receptors family 1 profile domain-containing protein n=1 Tax=Steinernema carpocapsae TaxID=34508 RepID=A0A4U5PGT2_STECR|nr:hypothetical protein L596_009483 [Steinernema carpocapsae]
MFYEMPNATVFKCTFVEVSSIAGYHISHLAVFWIALDRFMAVYHPVLYQRMSSRKVVIFRWLLNILFSWINTILIFAREDLFAEAPPLCRISGNWKTWYINYLYVWAASVCLANTILYILAIRKTRSILSTQTEIQKKIYYTFVYIIVVYILFWTIPKAIYFLAKKVLAKIPNFSLVSSIFLQINGVTDNIMTLGNFAIYGWRHREIRVAIKDMLCVKKGVHVTPINTQPF